jgi:hypothetical protein
MLNLSMSDSPTFKVQIPSAEELAKRTPKDFMDAIEFGMISSSQLGKADDYHLFAGLVDNELMLGQNEEFDRLSRMMQDTRMQIMESEGIQGLADIEKNPNYKPLVDAQNKIRQDFIKQTLPSDAVKSMLDSIAGAGNLLAEHQKIWRDRELELQQEVKNVEAEITKLTPPLEFKDGGVVPTLEQLEMQVKSLQIELETKKAEIQQCSMNAKILAPKMVSDFHKQLEKDIQQHIDRDDTKPTADDGMTLKQKKRIVSIQKEYYRLEKHKTPQTARNMVCRKYDIKPKTLKSYLTKDPKLPK